MPRCPPSIFGLVAPSKHLAYTYTGMLNLGMVLYLLSSVRVWYFIFIWYFCNTFLSTCKEYSQLEDFTIITYNMVNMPHNGATTSKSDNILLKRLVQPIKKWLKQKGLTAMKTNSLDLYDSSTLGLLHCSIFIKL